MSLYGNSQGETKLSSLWFVLRPSVSGPRRSRFRRRRPTRETGRPALSRRPFRTDLPRLPSRRIVRRVSPCGTTKRSLPSRPRRSVRPRSGWRVYGTGHLLTEPVLTKSRRYPFRVPSKVKRRPEGGVSLTLLRGRDRETGGGEVRIKAGAGGDRVTGDGGETRTGTWWSNDGDVVTWKAGRRTSGKRPRTTPRKCLRCRAPRRRGDCRVLLRDDGGSRTLREREWVWETDPGIYESVGRRQESESFISSHPRPVSPGDGE